MALIQGTGNQYVQEKTTRTAIPDRLHPPDQIEGWTDEQIHDVQVRIAGWLVEFGYEPGRLTKDEYDELRVVFEACGLPNHVLPRTLGTTQREDEYKGLAKTGRVSIKAPATEGAKQRARHKAHATCDMCGTCACKPNVKQVKGGLCEACTELIDQAQ